MITRIKKILSKEMPTPRELVQFVLADRVDIANGKRGIPIEKYEPWLQRVNASPDYDEYKMYLGAASAINEAIDLGEATLRQAYLSSAGLRMFYEALYFANSDLPNSRWDEYAISKIKPATIERGNWLWRNLRNTVKANAAVRGALKIAGEWLDVPKLESLLLTDKPLREEVDSLDSFATSTLAMIKATYPEPLGNLRDLFTPINFKLSAPTRDELDKVREQFKNRHVMNFYSTLSGAISTLNYYYEEPLPGEKNEG